MNKQQKKQFHQELPPSSDYLIPVKNINAFMFSEPDVGYINGKIEECEDNIVSLDVIRNRNSSRNKGSKKPTENPESPPGDGPSRPSADLLSLQSSYNTSKSASEKPDTVYNLDILSNSPPFDYPDPIEVETYTDLSSLRNDSLPGPTGDTSVNYADSFNTVSYRDSENLERSSIEDFQISIDEALEQIVCSDPFLSEKELLVLLRQENHWGLKITRRLLKKRLVKNGLENRYKRFRAYMAG
jgi:hypothetical protein